MHDSDDRLLRGEDALGRLLDRVSKGATIVITRHGKPMARLVPPDDETPKMTVAEAIEKMREFAIAHPFKASQIKGLIEEVGGPDSLRRRRFNLTCMAARR